ncbi:MAG: proline/glycine betaine ABC transporter permease [Nitrospirota bacterium]|nr:proline/glycine betaine ABC transporter permease [Nitrospirota bacterium]
MASEARTKDTGEATSQTGTSTLKSIQLVEAFVGPNADYYVRQFERISQQGFAGIRLNRAAALGGPLWAATRNLWLVFWFAAIGDLIALILIAQALWNTSLEVMGPIGQGNTDLFLGFLFLAVSRALTGFLANWAYMRCFTHWRSKRNLPSGTSWKAGLAGWGLVIAIYPLTVYRFSAPHVVEFIAKFPTTRFIKINTARAMDNVVDWMITHLETFFDSITLGVRTVLDFLELLFVGTPWPVTFLLIMLMAWRMAGPTVSMFSGVALLYVGLFGFWEKAMSTFSLVGAAVCLCMLLGAPLGIWCAKNRRLYSMLRPILDVMQTIPSFVYLIPAVAFFSIGKPPGILATIVFAMPPLIRLTALGIMQVPDSVREAAVAFGASPRQLLWKVEIPLALPSIMTGINQSIMMSLSMVVVAALIGAGGLGYDVLFALQHVETGNGVLAGVAIALLAMVLDRIVQGSREERQTRKAL